MQHLQVYTGLSREPWEYKQLCHLHSCVQTTIFDLLFTLLNFRGFPGSSSLEDQIWHQLFV